MLVPDKMYGLKVTPACKIHDWTLYAWNNKKGYELANNIFKNNLIRIIDQKGGKKQVKCLRKRKAVKYFKAVHYFGESSFFDSHLQYI